MKSEQIYKRIFPDTDMLNINHNGFVQVKCPFHNDTHESAGINPQTGFFNCFTCDTKAYNIEEFLAKYHNVPTKDAIKIAEMLDENKDINWQQAIKNLDDFDINDIMDYMHISEDTITKLQIGKTLEKGTMFSLPIIIDNVVCSVAHRYLPGFVDKDGKPKKTSYALGSKTGLIAPFDLWLSSPKTTLVCAGEKDMIIARDRGFNAITFTGGEMALPRMFSGHFKDKDFVIFYDNDDAGKEGAKRVAVFLDECGAKSIKIITDHYNWMENKEDCFDYFVKYGKTREDLVNLIKATPLVSKKELQTTKSKELPFLKLHEAREGSHRGKWVQSNVQVTSTYTTATSVPSIVEGYTKEVDEDGDVIGDWEKKCSWELDGDNAEAILKLMVDDEKLNKELFKLTGVGKFIKKKTPYFTKIIEQMTVYKASIIDYSEEDVISKVDDEQHSGEIEEITIYTLGEKLENGKAYNIVYKVVPHPLQAQNTVAIALKVSEATSGIQSFELSEETKASLRKFQDTSLEHMEKQFRDYTGNYIRKDLWLATDLTFHSVPRFMYHGDIKRGVVYASIIGESRTGKSEAVQGAIKKYKLGAIVNAKLASMVGIVGGSMNKDGGWKLTAGLIPRNHMMLVAAEEVQGAPEDYHKKLTEVKSSGRLRIVRSDGQLNMDCLVRLVEISNQKTRAGGTKKLEVYANGIEVISELIPAVEDIARQDFFVLVEEPNKYLERSDKSLVLPAYEDEDYKARVLWAWSRKPEQIRFAEGVEDFIWETAQALNKDYNSHVKIFGSETDLKIARLAISLAAMQVSTDDSFENIIIKKEHVAYIKNWLISIYDNPIFRLRQYVEEERSYAQVDEATINKLEAMYQAHPILLDQLEKSSSLQRNELQAISGLEAKDFNMVYNDLFRWKFIKLNQATLNPTERFRLGMRSINREIAPKEVGVPKVIKLAPKKEDLYDLL